MNIVETIGVRKAFGGTVALWSADLAVEQETIHGIVGPNGAGKSTLVRIVAGHIRPDEGLIKVRGASVTLPTPAAAQKLGIVAVPQEIALADQLSVAENVLLGNECRWGPLLIPHRARRRSAAVMRELGADVSVRVRAGSLRGSAQRLVMFAQALSRDASVIIVDEPTAGLSVEETEIVVGALEELKRRGRTIIFVSHRFNEVLRLCDRVTVVRDGLTTETLERSELSEQTLVGAVVGTETTKAEVDSARVVRDEQGLDVVSLRGRDLRGVSLAARRGEIVGVVGLVGSGVEELLAVMGGAATPTAGHLIVRGEQRRFDSPADALAAGVAYLPADRARAGLLEMPVRINIVISKTDRVAKGGFVTRGLERRGALDVLRRFGLERYCDRPLSSLSGGNRQKALIGRAIFVGADVLVLADPTVGVDFGARAELHELLRELANDGCTIIVSSSEPEELVAFVDRVVVMRRGQVGEILAGEGITIDALARASGA